MKNPVKKKLVKDWLFFAKENLLFAKSGMKEDFSPFHTICFLCQGSAEKYLKAFLLWNGWKLKKTHDMSELVELCCENNYMQLKPGLTTTRQMRYLGNDGYRKILYS